MSIDVIASPPTPGAPNRPERDVALGPQHGLRGNGSLPIVRPSVYRRVPSSAPTCAPYRQWHMLRSNHSNLFSGKAAR